MKRLSSSLSPSFASPALTLALALLASSIAATTAACSSSGGTPDAGCTAYQVPAGTDLTKPAVSFSSDVVPILVNSCAFSSCHGAASGGNNGIKLGSKTATVSPTEIHDALVGKPAAELPAMSFVTAGDPSHSYVMHKLDGDLCTLSDRCTDHDCQSPMPQGADSLPVEQRDTIRRWIAQGAQNN